MAAAHSAFFSGAQAVRVLTRAEHHPDCVICGTRSGFGLGVSFQACAPGKVRAVFACHPLLQSYPETLHGGVTAALLDAAMTNCLFSLGIVAVTAELTIRYVSPINLQNDLELSATLDESHAPLHTLRAEVKQNGTAVARAKAKFFEKSSAKKCACEEDT